jgi:hypothetical protein
MCGTSISDPLAPAPSGFVIDWDAVLVAAAAGRRFLLDGTKKSAPASQELRDFPIKFVCRVRI